MGCIWSLSFATIIAPSHLQQQPKQCTPRMNEHQHTNAHTHMLTYTHAHRWVQCNYYRENYCASTIRIFYEGTQIVHFFFFFILTLKHKVSMQKSSQFSPSLRHAASMIHLTPRFCYKWSIHFQETFASEIAPCYPSQVIPVIGQLELSLVPCQMSGIVISVLYDWLAL